VDLRCRCSLDLTPQRNGLGIARGSRGKRNHGMRSHSQGEWTRTAFACIEVSFDCGYDPRVKCSLTGWSIASLTSTRYNSASKLHG
jgi:hypothetical protein